MQQCGETFAVIGGEAGAELLQATHGGMIFFIALEVFLRIDIGDAISAGLARGIEVAEGNIEYDFGVGQNERGGFRVSPM